MALQQEKGTPKKKASKRNKKMQQNSLWNILTVGVLSLMMFTLLYGYGTDKKNTEDTTLTKVAEAIHAGDVKELVVRGDTVEVHHRDTARPVGIAKKEGYATPITETLVNLGVTAEELRAIALEVKDETGAAYWLGVLSPFLFPLLLLGFIVFFFSRSMRGMGAQALNFGASKARMIHPDDEQQKVTFADVAGAKEAKIELEEIVDFLKNPKKFTDIGAAVPKGVMMMGAPGTGKTLLARAIAGEANVPFFSISGSEFVEMFVGVGASRVRDLFQTAKKMAPAIIFIDEIDAVGRSRGTGMGGGNDEREQTLNQILTEMDGFEPTEKLIVIAATNRPDVLDTALMRPGRFDRRVTIDLPDRDGRLEILKIHARKKPLAADVNLGIVAQRTPGFSGADLASLMNEAAILAAREGRKEVAQFDAIRSIEKVMLGPERKSHLLTKEERKVTAYHEAGHALVASVLPYADPVQKISIISRGRAAGYTLKLPDTDRKMKSRKEFLDDIAMSLGGYVAELMIFDDLTTGPSNDLQVATNLARDMVVRFGMSEKFGPVALEGTGGRLIGGGLSEDRGFSPEKAREIDEEVTRIIRTAEDRAREALTVHRKALDAVAEKLIEVEALERDDYEAILKKEGVEIKDAYREEKVVADPTKI